MNSILHGVECVLLDMDGTIHLSGVAIDGAIEAVSRIRASGRRVVYLTNNTSIPKSDYVLKLTRMGFAASDEDVYSAGSATIDYLHTNCPNQSVYLLGTEALKQEWLERGINVVEENFDASVVVVAFDTSLTYARLSHCCTLIRNGARYIATHPDYNCPTLTGYIPDVGSFVAAIEASTNRRPEVVCGKPEQAMATLVARHVGLAGRQIAMVGDRLMTDMQFAINNDFVSILVLTGEATRADLDNSRLIVDCVIDSIAKL